MPRILIITGLAIAALGAILWLLQQIGFRGLPGDIRYESPHFRFYFPVATSILLSILLTLILWLIRWMSKP